MAHRILYCLLLSEILDKVLSSHVAFRHLFQVIGDKEIIHELVWPCLNRPRHELIKHHLRIHLLELGFKLGVLIVTHLGASLRSPTFLPFIFGLGVLLSLTRPHFGLVVVCLPLVSMLEN